MIDNKRLGEYFDNLPIKEHGKMIRMISRACKVNRQVVYHWKYGNCQVPVELYKTIEKIIGQEIF